MGWLRLVGSLKLQVSFAKEHFKREDILQKRPIILRSLLVVATPYTCTNTNTHHKDGTTFEDTLTAHTHAELHTLTYQRTNLFQ